MRYAFCSSVAAAALLAAATITPAKGQEPAAPPLVEQLNNGKWLPQEEAESLVLPLEQERLDQLDRQGAQDNLMAYIGMAVAGVGLSSGIALIVVGSKKRKAAGAPESATLRIGPYFRGGKAGLSFTGNF